jgi:tRNA(Ile)-lysidine synthetase-like protein
MSTIIRDFWLSHPDYWIATKNREEIDRIIYDKFRNYDCEKEREDDLGKIIYLDQFVRHFSRITPISEPDILEGRRMAANIVKKTKHEDILKTSDKELIWFLMPWKHLSKWDNIFQTIHTWLDSRPLTDFTYLNRFFMDTYKKAYTEQKVAANIKLTPTYNQYDKNICEVFPQEYTNPDAWIEILTHKNIQSKPLLDALSEVCSKPNAKAVAISLSGGVDSMLMTALLAKTKADVVAIHIVYGNRSESQHERNFLAEFCQRLDIRLYTYSIEWLRRGQVDRAFYERVTRDIRFNVYKAIGRPVLLGHIQEDVVENIWTNLAHGNNLDNLAKISVASNEEGVRLFRPWINIQKSRIYDIAKAIALPYLKNTTPSWSNRGKFREAFHAATVTQYGEAIDEKMLEVADRFKKQSDLLDQLLFQPIRNSWNEDEKSINVSQALSMKLDGHSWQRILKDLTHTRLGTGMPGFLACDDFAKRVARGIKEGQIIKLSKKLTVRFSKKSGETWITIV